METELTATKINSSKQFSYTCHRAEWYVLYLTTWWPPSPWRFHLASFALFHLSLGLRGCRGPARPARPEHGRVRRAYLAHLWLSTLAQEMHLNPSVPCGAMMWRPHVLNPPLCRLGR